MESASHESLNQRIEQMQNSQEYKVNCQRFSKECMRLETIALALYTRKEQLQAHCEAATVRKEYASGSTLHRGFYCPSPTYDIIVGNTKRGRLLKRRSAISKTSHEYGFDADGKLLYCKWFFKEKPTYTEYLVYEDSCIYGITFSIDGNLAFFTEEVFKDGKLTDFSNCLFLPLGDTPSCLEISQEHYEYDSEGLCLCDMHHYMQLPPGAPESVLAMIPQSIYQHIGKYQFRRKNGLLISCTNQQGHEYQVHTQRKA